MIKKASLMALAAILVLGTSWLCAQDSSKGEKDKPIHLKTKDVSEPVLVNKVNPSYPASAKQDRVQGAVVLEIKIGVDGAVLEAKATKASDPRLADAAIDAVKQWKFKPALNKAGKPVEVIATVNVNFKLK